MRVRKIAAAMAAVSMLAAFSAQAAFAAGDSVNVTAEKVNAEAGAEFTLAVKLDGVPSTGINAAEFALTYDASALTITGVAPGDCYITVRSASDPTKEAQIKVMVTD